MIKTARFETQHHTSIASFVLFASLFFCSYSTRLFAVDIEISKFDAVSGNVSRDIVVFLDPSPVMEEEKVCLSLRAIEGTGKAVFVPGRHTTTNITQTSILQITGDQLSSIEGNMILEAKVREAVVASNIFTVVDANMITEKKAVKPMAPATKDKVKKEAMITKSRAIEIATAATKGKVAIQEGAPITVELKGQDYIVTFGWIPPKGIKGPVLGPDFSAKVTLDAFTGSVKNGIQMSE